MNPARLALAATALLLLPAAAPGAAPPGQEQVTFDRTIARAKIAMMADPQAALAEADRAFAQAAALPLAGVTAYRAAFTRAGVQAHERVLITGIGGGVALLAMQMAVARGAQVWVTSGSEEKI